MCVSVCVLRSHKYVLHIIMVVKCASHTSTRVARDVHRQTSHDINEDNQYSALLDLPFTLIFNFLGVSGFCCSSADITMAV